MNEWIVIDPMRSKFDHRTEWRRLILRVSEETNAPHDDVHIDVFISLFVYVCNRCYGLVYVCNKFVPSEMNFNVENVTSKVHCLALCLYLLLS